MPLLASENPREARASTRRRVFISKDDESSATIIGVEQISGLPTSRTTPVILGSFSTKKESFLLIGVSEGRFDASDGAIDSSTVAASISDFSLRKINEGRGIKQKENRTLSGAKRESDRAWISNLAIGESGARGCNKRHPRDRWSAILLSPLVFSAETSRSYSRVDNHVSIKYEFMGCAWLQIIRQNDLYIVIFMTVLIEPHFVTNKNHVYDTIKSPNINYCRYIELKSSLDQGQHGHKKNMKQVGIDPPTFRFWLCDSPTEDIDANRSEHMRERSLNRMAPHLTSVNNSFMRALREFEPSLLCKMEPSFFKSLYIPRRLRDIEISPLKSVCRTDAPHFSDRPRLGPLSWERRQSRLSRKFKSRREHKPGSITLSYINYLGNINKPIKSGIGIKQKKSGGLIGIELAVKGSHKKIPAKLKLLPLKLTRSRHIESEARRFCLENYVNKLVITRPRSLLKKNSFLSWNHLGSAVGTWIHDSSVERDSHEIKKLMRYRGFELTINLFNSQKQPHFFQNSRGHPPTNSTTPPFKLEKKHKIYLRGKLTRNQGHRIGFCLVLPIQKTAHISTYNRLQQRWDINCDHCGGLGKKMRMPDFLNRTNAALLKKQHELRRSALGGLVRIKFGQKTCDKLGSKFQSKQFNGSRLGGKKRCRSSNGLKNDIKLYKAKITLLRPIGGLRFLLIPNAKKHSQTLGQNGSVTLYRRDQGTFSGRPDNKTKFTIFLRLRISSNTRSNVCCRSFSKESPSGGTQAPRRTFPDVTVNFFLELKIRKKHHFKGGMV